MEMQWEVRKVRERIKALQHIYFASFYIYRVNYASTKIIDAHQIEYYPPFSALNYHGLTA